MWDRGSPHLYLPLEFRFIWAVCSAQGAELTALVAILEGKKRGKIREFPNIVVSVSDFFLFLSLACQSACLTSTRPCDLLPALCNWGVVVCASDPSPHEVETGGPVVQGCPSIHRKFEAQEKQVYSRVSQCISEMPGSRKIASSRLARATW